MALDRPVKMDDGTVLSHHEVAFIYQYVGDQTTIEVTSWESAEKAPTCLVRTTRLEIDYADGITEAEAYEVVAASPEFSEWVDPAQSALDSLIPTLSDEQADVVPQVWPGWDVGTSYAIGDRVRWEGVLWRCLQAHTSQEGWEPGRAVSLWVRTTPEGTIPEWVQPTGAHDAYATGDRVRHNGTVWASTVDANVWEPGVYGWDQVQANS